MALRWGNRTDPNAPAMPTEQEIKDLTAKAQEAEKLKTDLAAKDAQLTGLTSQVEQLSGQIKNLEMNAQRPTNPPPGGGQPSTPTSVLDDEEAAFREHLAPVVSGLVGVAGQTAKMVAEQRIRSDPKRSRLFTRFHDETEKLFATVPPEYRQFPETYENVFNQVVGKHTDEIIAESAKTGGQFFVEPGGGAPPPEPAKEPTLTEDEQIAARRMKISPEKYLASKKAMQSAGGHVSFARTS